ncbi:hypothetical protein ALQ04_02894 [Pseudomonas cichorii]|uniref:FAD-binding domain-containing protein n=1 Tax=Pseudomonas cichorii TaxID=36746 RepID=A0A3M4M966_PSECI|nr:NAD(P)/FAD-dependent oxidoreductase [Pseudomonas cichorii]RMQ50438.1 hypothetical protein ALQ04_02894 [Pseudomonas cichorii]
MSTVADLKADVLVLGSGPAACSLALNLAPFHNVLMVDKGEGKGLSVGESLPAAAGRLFRDMGLLDEFLQQNHAPCLASRGAWGSHQSWDQHAMRNLDGHGWHLDRRLFDAWLLQVAQKRGAALLQKTRLVNIHEPSGDTPWRLEFERAGQRLTVDTRFVIDATGRSSAFARLLGYKRLIKDKLVCGWVFGEDRIEGGISELHAEAGGWWYTSPLPGNRRLLSFYTDADLDTAGSAYSSEGLLARLQNVPELRSNLASHGFTASEQHGFCAAHTAMLEQVAGENWLAVGDAALSFDPLSAQGLFNALYTGLAGAQATHLQLQGDGEALSLYQAELQRIESAYMAHIQAWYHEESRWQDQPFWQRRQTTTALQ